MRISTAGRARSTCWRLEDAYAARHDTVEPNAVIDFLAFDVSNPSSIVNCLRAARENAHAVRGSITSEMWETLQRDLARGARYRTIPLRRTQRRRIRRLGEIPGAPCPRRRAGLDAARRGATISCSIGSFLERLDGVARMLLIRLACEAPAADGAAQSDHFPWSMLLRSLSAFEIFRRVSRDSVNPLRVLEFVVLRPDVPRSLFRSAELVYENLQAVANAQSGETQRRAGDATRAAALRHARELHGRRRRALPRGRSRLRCRPERPHRT